MVPGSPARTYGRTMSGHLNEFGITHLRHVDLAVPDFETQRTFYKDTWGLTEQGKDGNLSYFAAEGSPEQYVVRLREADEKRLDLISFGADSVASVDALAAKLGSEGVQVVALDKTGTLTEGQPALTDLDVAEGFARAEVLALMAAVEARSQVPGLRQVAEPGDGIAQVAAGAGRGVGGHRHHGFASCQACGVPPAVAPGFEQGELLQEGTGGEVDGTSGYKA